MQKGAVKSLAENFKEGLLEVLSQKSIGKYNKKVEDPHSEDGESSKSLVIY